MRTDSQPDSQPASQPDRQPDRQTDRQIDNTVQESRFTTDCGQELGAAAVHEPHGSVWSGKGRWRVGARSRAIDSAALRALPANALMESR